ncbi:STAS domain-containing protein, partial [bacterium]|nr:STAS domain-containing protein [bacterium]
RCEQGVYIVNLSGIILLETVDDFKRVCIEHLLDKHTIFNLSELSFVGSTGITVFLESIKRIYNSREKKVKMVGVSSEFEKIFVTNLTDMVEFFDNEKQAFMSIFQPERVTHHQPQQTQSYNQPQQQSNYNAVQGMDGMRFQQEQATQQQAQQSQNTHYHQPAAQPQPQVVQAPPTDTLCDMICRRIRERQILEAEGLAYIVNKVAFNDNDRKFTEEMVAPVNNVAVDATT